MSPSAPASLNKDEQHNYYIELPKPVCFNSCSPKTFLIIKDNILSHVGSVLFGKKILS